MANSSTQAWLEKATFSTSDLATAGVMSPGQAANFIRVAIDSSPVLKDVRNEFIPQPTYEVNRVSMNSRILRPGTEGSRLSDGDRVKPTTGKVTLSSVLLRAELPLTDETFEDNIERDAFADTVMTMAAECVGRDVEELILKGDTARTGGEDAYLDLLDGIIKQAQSNFPSGQKLDATAETNYDVLFGKTIKAMPDKYRRNYQNLRLYFPVSRCDDYQTSLSARGTGLGDQAILTNMQTALAFRGVPVVRVPMLTGTDNINSGSVDYSKFGLLIDPSNIIVGWHRIVKTEQWRDPREGVTSLIISCRVDVKLAVPDMGVLVYNNNIVVS